MRKKNPVFLFFLIFLIGGICHSEPAWDDAQAVPFSELWGYVMIGEENELSAENPCTDIGYFVSAFNEYSEFPAVPERANRFGNEHNNRRIHIVTSVDSRSQTHLLLDPSLPLRKKVIKSLVASCKTYDGLQIDWELVPKRDAEQFLSFLREIKKKLKGKTLSVAVPARVRTLETDPYSYAAVSEIADKIIVMAYDEHWSTSKPGPVASREWCARVADYAKTVVPPEKLVMGCPFYSRAWNDENVGGKAYRNRNVRKILAEHKDAAFSESRSGDLSFSFKTETTVSVFYDTSASSLARCRAYKENGIDRLAFWRIGQEEREFWAGITAFQAVGDAE